MILSLRLSLKAMCLVGSVVCLAASSYCLAAGCTANGGGGYNGQCLMGHFFRKSVAGSYADATPVCTKWSQDTCLNLYVPSGQDNNGQPES